MPVFAELKEIPYKSAEMFNIVTFKCSKLLNLGNSFGMLHHHQCGIPIF